MAEYTIKDVKDILHRRKKTIIAVIITAMILLFSIIFLSRPEPIYEAETAIRVEKVTTLGEMLTGRVQVGDPISTAGSMIKSFIVLEAVAKKAGLIPSNILSEQVKASAEYMAIIKDLEWKITVEREKGANILSIKVQQTDGKKAKELANYIAEIYRDVAFYERNKNILEERRIVSEKLLELEAKLKGSREKLTSFRKGLELSSVSDEQKLAISNYVTKTQRVDNLIRSNNLTKEKIKVLKVGREFEGERVKWIHAGGVQESLLGALNAKLNELKLKEEELLVHYTRAHPALISINEQKDAVVKQMIHDLAAFERQQSDEAKMLDKDIQMLQTQLKDIPDVLTSQNMLEKEVAINEDLYTKMLLAHQETTLKQAGITEEVTIARYAVKPSIPINRVAFIGNFIVSFFLSVIFGFIGGFVHEAVDTIPRKVDNIADILGLPVLSVIPDWNTPEMIKLTKAKYPDIADAEVMKYLSLSSHFMPETYVAEQYKATVPNILLISKDTGVKAVAVLHPVNGEGSSIYAANLAISLSQTGRTVALVDADFKEPSIHKLFGINRQPGLTDVLMGHYVWDEAIRRITDIMLGEIRSQHLLTPPGLDNLYIFTNGQKTENSSTFINSKRMDEVLVSLKTFFDFVVVDISPVLIHSEASILANKIDAAVLLTEYERLPRGTLLKLRSHLETLKVKLLGLVINKGYMKEV